MTSNQSQEDAECLLAKSLHELVLLPHRYVRRRCRYSSRTRRQIWRQLLKEKTLSVVGRDSQRSARARTCLGVTDVGSRIKVDPERARAASEFSPRPPRSPPPTLDSQEAAVQDYDEDSVFFLSADRTRLDSGSVGLPGLTEPTFLLVRHVWLGGSGGETSVREQPCRVFPSVLYRAVFLQALYLWSIT